MDEGYCYGFGGLGGEFYLGSDYCGWVSIFSAVSIFNHSISFVLFLKLPELTKPNPDSADPDCESFHNREPHGPLRRI